MWSLSKGGPERPMASRTWTLRSPATDHRSCPGGRRQRAFTVLTFFLFLPRFPASSCPDVCSCSLGKVNCVDRRLRFVPLQLPTNATALLLDYNRIAILRNDTFAAQKVLRRLSLGNNVLASIHRLALVGLHELQDLDLSDNSLSLLHPETFLPVPTLRTLKLGNNRLLRLEPELPGALPHLRALFVHSNALTSLPAGFFENLPSLSYLTLEDNPWTCSCGIRPLYLWLVKNRDKVPEVNSVTCKRRASLAQYPVLTLGNESFARCQAPWMHLPGYAFFLLIGPSTFLASICVGILLGSLAVAHLKLRRTGSCIWPRAPVRRIIGGPLPVSFLPSFFSNLPWCSCWAFSVVSFPASAGDFQLHLRWHLLLPATATCQVFSVFVFAEPPKISRVAVVGQLTSKSGLRLGNREHIYQPVFLVFDSARKEQRLLWGVFEEILFKFRVRKGNIGCCLLFFLFAVNLSKEVSLQNVCGDSQSSRSRLSQRCFFKRQLDL